MPYDLTSSRIAIGLVYEYEYITRIFLQNITHTHDNTCFLLFHAEGKISGHDIEKRILEFEIW